MSSRDSGNRPIIVIRRRRKKGGEGHHGGAWKVAYADFVTAMMAFVLLLWLLNTVTTEQRQGIADYFDTAGVSTFQGGARIFSSRNNLHYMDSNGCEWKYSNCYPESNGFG